jgi:competence protein ComEC
LNFIDQRMRLLLMPFVGLFFVFSAGIVLADLVPVDWHFSCVIALALLLVSLVSQQLKTHTGSWHQRLQFLWPLLLFFSLGMFRYELELPQQDPYAVERVYLPGDKLVGEITAIANTSSGDFKKCELSVHNVIRFRDTLAARGKVLVFLEDPAGMLKRKDVCLLKAELAPVTNQHNPGEFDSRKFWKHKGIGMNAFVNVDRFVVIGCTEWVFRDWFDDLREYFSALLDRFLDGDENAVAKGLILGDRSSIDGEITRKFGNTGAMHVLAVSGLHVAILVQILTAFFGVFSRWISKNQAILLALAVVWIYSFLTGLSASVVRSAFMFTVLAGGTLLGRKYNNFNNLAFSGVLILCWNPHFLYDIGFQLSYLAMVGIFLFYQPLSKVFYTRFKWVQAAFEGTMVGIAAQIMTVPLTLYYFHQFPNYFILTNLGLMVFSFVVLALGIGLFVSFWLVPLAKVVAFLLTFSLFLMLWIIDFVDGLPGAVSSGFVLQVWEVALLFGLILWFFSALKRQRIKQLMGSLALSLLLVAGMVITRLQGMQTQEICFLSSKEPIFIVKQGSQSFCFFASRQQLQKKARYAAEAYQKVLPGALHYFEISHSKETNVHLGHEKVRIERVRGGYQIEMRKRSFFYALSDKYENPKGEIVCAPWLSGNPGDHLLTDGAVRFEL